MKEEGASHILFVSRSFCYSLATKSRLQKSNCLYLPDYQRNIDIAYGVSQKNHKPGISRPQCLNGNSVASFMNSIASLKAKLVVFLRHPVYHCQAINERVELDFVSFATRIAFYFEPEKIGQIELFSQETYNF